MSLTIRIVVYEFFVCYINCRSSVWIQVISHPYKFFFRHKRSVTVFYCIIFFCDDITCGFIYKIFF